MSAPQPQLLVVANPAESEELTRLLAGSGFAVATGDGGDDTFNLYESLEPDVVVLCANLDSGDARALAGAMRDEAHGRVVKIVLVGEESGPIRNALDASDFAVDRFVGRPLSAKALEFAVKTCVELAARARAGADAADDDADDDEAKTKSRVDEAMDRAIDDFVHNAFAALDDADAVASDPQIPMAPVGHVSEVDIGWDDPAPPPPREPTLILSGGSAPPASAPVDEPVTLDELDDDELAGVLPPDPLGDLRDELEDDDDSATHARSQTDSGVHVLGNAVAEAMAQRDDSRAPPPTGGEFARELRRKMSKMAERLFPGQGNVPDVGVAHGHATEIDLASLDTDRPAIDDAGPYMAISGAPTLSDARDDSWRSAPTPAVPAAEGSQPSGTDGRSASVEATNVLRAPVQQDTDGATVVQRASTSDVQTRGELSVSETDVAMLIARLFAAEFSGRVVFHRDRVEKTVLFERGRPTFARSALPHDRMGALLMREGKITREQHEECRAVVAESGRRMGAVLVEKGYLKRRELLPAVRRHIEDIIYSLFAWETGNYTVTHGEYAVDEKIRLSRHPAAIVLEGIRRKYSLERLEHRFGSSAAVIMTTGDDKLGAILEAADLAGAEVDAIRAMDGDHDIAAAADRGNLDELAAFQLAFGLVILGAAKIVRRGEEDDAATTPARSPALVGATDIAIDRQRVLAKYAHVNEADYFTLLGVRRDASSFEIKRAYEAALRDYAADSFPVEVRQQLGNEIGEISELLTEAFHVLHNDDLRASYLANLRD